MIEAKVVRWFGDGVKLDVGVADFALDSASPEDGEARTNWTGFRHGAERLTRLAGDVALLAELGTAQALGNLPAKMTVRDDLAEAVRATGLAPRSSPNHQYLGHPASATALGKSTPNTRRMKNVLTEVVALVM